MTKPKIPAAPSLTTLQPNAAGADIGAREIYVAVPPNRSTSVCALLWYVHRSITRARRLAARVSHRHGGDGGH